MKKRGNPWHDARGRFCSGPSGKAIRDFDAEEEAPKSISPKFVSAKNKKEAESFARSMGIKPHFKGIPLDKCNAINESVSMALYNNPSSRFVKNVGSTENICEGYTTEMYSAYRKSLDETAGNDISGEEKDRIAKEVVSISKEQLKRSDGTVAMIHSNGEVNKDISRVLNKYSGIYISERAENMSVGDIKMHITKALMQEKV